MVDIPGLMAEFQSFIGGTKAGSMLPLEMTRRQLKLWSSIASIEEKLQKWKREWADSYPKGQQHEIPVPIEAEAMETLASASASLPAMTNNKLPIFQFRDLTTRIIVTPPRLGYPDAQLARTMCMYYTALLVLSWIDIRPNGLQPRDRHDFACRICRSMEYYVSTTPGRLVNQVVFALRAAYDALPEGDIERQWLEALFGMIVKSKGMNSWKDVSPYLSVRNRL